MREVRALRAIGMVPATRLRSRERRSSVVKRPIWTGIDVEISRSESRSSVSFPVASQVIAARMSGSVSDAGQGHVTSFAVKEVTPSLLRTSWTLDLSEREAEYEQRR